MNQPEEEYELRLEPRPSTSLALKLPNDALASLEQVAADRDMSPEALIRYYVGQGLRNDLSRIYGERLLDRTAQVLARHLPSQEEVSAIMREIRAAEG